MAFEVDDIDPVTHTGWSVVVQGVGEELTEAYRKTFTRARALVPESWAPGAKDHLVRIVPAHITGRRLSKPSRP